MSQASTLANETYAYDQAGRLTEAQETPTGEGCTTRLYDYEEDSNEGHPNVNEAKLASLAGSTAVSVRRNRLTPIG